MNSLDAPRRPSLALVLLIFAALFAAQILLYAKSFSTGPSGDDFSAPLTEIARGNAQGPAVFFTRSAQAQNYRPIQSLLMWAFGSRSPDRADQVFWIRVLHLACMALYAAVAVLWLRMLPISAWGAAAAGAMLFLHPVMTGPVGGIDGFSGPFATAFMWLGALTAIRFANQLTIAVPIIMLCFFIGGMTKEYSFGIGPLAVWGTWLFARQHRWRNAIIVGASLAISLALLMWIRRYTIPPGLEGGLSYINIDPIIWARNIAMLATSLLFVGNTAWVMVRGDLLAFACVAVICLIMLAWLGLGLWFKWRSSGSRSALPAVTGSASQPTRSIGRWLVYLLAAIPMAAATPILTERVSEMYTVGLVLPFALLAGLALDGWLLRQGRMRAAGIALLVAGVGLAIVSTWQKVAMLHASGVKAERHLRQVLQALPEDAEHARIAIVNLRNDLERNRYYSVFVIDDHLIIGQPYALDWVAPERRLHLTPHVVDDLQSFDGSTYDHVLLWRPEWQRYDRVK